jgi:hypothetical protein
MGRGRNSEFLRYEKNARFRAFQTAKNQASPYKRRQIIISVADNLLALDTCDELCNVISVTYDLLALDA